MLKFFRLFSFVNLFKIYTGTYYDDKSGSLTWPLMFFFLPTRRYLYCVNDRICPVLRSFKDSLHCDTFPVRFTKFQVDSYAVSKVSSGARETNVFEVSQTTQSTQYIFLDSS